MPAHSHDQAPGDAGARRLGIAVAINLLLTAAQIIGGVLAGSLSLVADALHNFSDAAGLLLALIARRISKRPADEDRTFGYGRASVVGGLINLTSIIVIAGYLLIEAIMRAFERPEVDGWIVVSVAGIALAVDVATAVLTYAMSKSSINIKAAFLHNLADALASVVVIITGTLIILFDWYWTDLVATIGISIYIVWMSLSPLKRCIRILMQSTPEDVDIRALADAIASCEGVEGVFHLHVWMIDEHTRSVEVRVVVDDRRISELVPLRLQIEQLLAESFDAAHATIEFVNGSAADRPLIARH